MATVVTFVQDQKEQQVLRIILESYGFDVVQLEPTHKGFLQSVQYSPKAILFEIPSDFKEQLNLISQLKSSMKTKQVPILGYGSHNDSKTLLEIKRAGVTKYVERPLQTSDIQEVFVPKTGKAITLHKKEQKVYEGELEDSAQIMSTDTSATTRIEIMVKRIGELLAFPFTIAKVLNVTQSASTGAKDLALAIEVDPVIVSEVLKVASSAYYSGANRSNTAIGVKDAIVRIGFTETKNIAISLSVMKLFTDEEKSVGFSREDFWYHSLSVAVIAGKLAKQANYPKPEIAFVCGLLHDFGIILIDEFFPAYLQTTLQETSQRGESFLKVQKEKWGMTHNDVVRRLFSEWNMPNEVLEVITNFYSYKDYENSADAQMVKLVHIVGLSDKIAKSLALGRECDEFVSLIPNEILKTLKCPVSFKDSFFEQVSKELTMFSSYLNLKTDKVEFTRTPLEKDIFHKIAIIDENKQIFNPFEYYMISQKNLLTYIDMDTDFSNLEVTPDVLVVFASQEQTTDEFSELFSLKRIVKQEKNSSDESVEESIEEENTEDTEMLPVIIVGGQDGNEETPLPDHVAHLPTELDLRVLCFSIESLNLGHSFSLKGDIEKELVDTQGEEIKDKEVTEKPFEFKTRVVESFVVVIELHGNVKVDKFKDLINVMITLLNKTKYLGVDFSFATEIPNEFLILLNNFKKVIKAKNGVVSSFAIIPADNSEEDSILPTDILRFESDSEFATYLKESIKL
jgi:HD-like signal output (HDOD) protein/FixJ family two-component response regulator